MPWSGQIIRKLAMMVQYIHPNGYQILVSFGPFRTPLRPANLELTMSRHRTTSCVSFIYLVVAWRCRVYASGDIGDLFTHPVPSRN
jgi:hypothetical protein